MTHFDTQTWAGYEAANRRAKFSYYRSPFASLGRTDLNHCLCCQILTEQWGVCLTCQRLDSGWAAVAADREWVYAIRRADELDPRRTKSSGLTVGSGGTRTST